MKPTRRLADAKQEIASRNVEAERRLGTMRTAPRFLDGEWPGQPELKLKVAGLSRTDIAECRSAAWAYLQNDLKLDPTAVINLDLYEEECVTQILFRALRDPDDPTVRLASDARDLRDAMTADEQKALFELFTDFADDVDPSPDRLGPELTRAIEDAVKKKDADLLRGFGGRKLAAFMTSTAYPLTSSPIGKSGDASSLPEFTTSSPTPS